MHFGRLPEHLLDKVNFNLLPDPPQNRIILGGQATPHPKIYVGCTEWSQRQWKGILFPANLPVEKMLNYYTQQFNCIELNATHYKIYTPEAIGNWVNKTANSHFRFCPKMYQGITHAETLADKESLSGEFVESVAAFGEHLGPIFIQLSDAFGPHRKEELFRYLESLPGKPFSFFLELRHPAWFADAAIRNELFETLTALNIGAVITDVASRRDVAHMQLTIPKAMIRFQGYSPHHTDENRINAWVRRITYWLQNGLQELYFFMHQHPELYAPQMADLFIDKLNSSASLQIARPVFEIQQGSLF